MVANQRGVKDFCGASHKQKCINTKGSENNVAGSYAITTTLILMILVVVVQEAGIGKWREDAKVRWSCATQ